MKKKILHLILLRGKEWCALLDQSSSFYLWAIHLKASSMCYACGWLRGDGMALFSLVNKWPWYHVTLHVTLVGTAIKGSESGGDRRMALGSKRWHMAC